MSRLPRPYVPLSVRAQVAIGQIGMSAGDAALFRATFGAGSGLLDVLLRVLRAKHGVGQREKLHLDHDPPLAAREKVRLGGEVVGYVPDANDPEYLRYRTADGHKLKTNVRGDGAQYPDRVLIKRQRRRERAGGAKKAKRRWPSRPLRGAGRWPKRGVAP